MVRKTLHTCLLTLVMIFTSVAMMAQTTVSGTITDGEGEGLIGASVIIKGTVTGTVTDFDGSYEFSTSQEPPFTVVISFVGFETQEVEVSDANATVDLQLKEQSIMGSEVVFSASRKPEKIIESPVSIERMDATTIKNTASANFYDAIENLKGVQMGTNSLTFKSVNTRGFASFANTRFVQLIDGMDNAAPGLNFPAGNLVGISELDVNSVELVPGAASALYGPNAFNGILLMRSKDPFYQPGLSVMLKGGITQQASSAGTKPFGEFGFRYAKPLSDKVAIKFNFSALQGTDWHAIDYNDIDGGAITDPDYDGINKYGDEVATSIPLTDPSTGLSIPTRVARTGYEELDLVDDDFDATSYKMDGAVHWKAGKNAELIYNYRFGSGQSVYQGANRYRLRGLSLQQHKLELKGDNYMLRGYTTIENAGNSYDTKFMAFNINRYAKSDQNWFLDYILAYNGALGAIPGIFDGIAPAPFDHDAARAFADSNLLNNNNLSATQAGVLDFILSEIILGLPQTVPGIWQREDRDRLVPGTSEFGRVKDFISNYADLANGSRFIDNTKLYHAEGNYNLAPHIKNFMDVLIGGSYRHFILDSGGTIFNDGENGFSETIPISEYGTYVQLSKKFLDERLSATASVRYDKSQNFKGQISPRASLVYSLGENRQHNLRASWQTGHRNPDTQPQYISLDLGAIILLGTTQENMENWSVDRFYGANQQATILGTMVRDNSYTLTSVQQFSGAVAAAVAGGMDQQQAAIANAGLLQKATVDYVQPEKVTVYELGYKGLPTKDLFFDANVYFNKYEDFISQYQVITPAFGSVLDGSAIPSVGAGTFEVFQLYGNASADVSTLGAGFNAEYSLPKNFKIGANYSYSKLFFDQESDPDFRPSFNTPEHRFRVSIGNSDIWKGLGFNISYRWTDSYEWQASFADGLVDSYGVMDMQISAKIPPIKSTVKLGVANLLNDEYRTAVGAANVGRQAYISFIYDELFR